MNLFRIQKRDMNGLFPDPRTNFLRLILVLNLFPSLRQWCVILRLRILKHYIVPQQNNMDILSISLVEVVK